MPTAATQQMASPGTEAAGTPFRIDQPPSEERVPTCMKQHASVEDDSDANIAYLKKMQRRDVLQLLDAMNLSVYKDAFEREHIDGETMACLTSEMLCELGVFQVPTQDASVEDRAWSNQCQFIYYYPTV